jgi:lipid-binding SYLF domain-containing protein
MKKIFTSFIILVLLAIGSLSFAASEEDGKYTTTMQVFRDSDAVKRFFDNCYGYALFPTIGKAGWVVGGSYGKGWVYRNEEITGRVSVIEGSIGFQFGGKAFSEIIFFEDKRAYDEFTSGSFEFDATIQATAITAGAGAQAGSSGGTAGATAGPKTGVQANIKYYKGMAVFIHSKGGLMVEASVGGQKFSFTPLTN